MIHRSRWWTENYYVIKCQFTNYVSCAPSLLHRSSTSIFLKTYWQMSARLTNIARTTTWTFNFIHNSALKGFSTDAFKDGKQLLSFFTVNMTLPGAFCLCNRVSTGHGKPGKPGKSCFFFSSHGKSWEILKSLKSHGKPGIISREAFFLCMKLLIPQVSHTELFHVILLHCKKFRLIS